MSTITVRIKTPYQQFVEHVPNVYQAVKVTTLNSFGKEIDTYHRGTNGYWYDYNKPGSAPLSIIDALSIATSIRIEIQDD